MSTASAIPPSNGKYQIVSFSNLASYVGQPVMLFGRYDGKQGDRFAKMLDPSKEENVFLLGVEPNMIPPDTPNKSLFLIEGHVETRQKVKAHHVSIFPEDAEFEPTVYDEMVTTIIEQGIFLTTDSTEKKLHFGTDDPGPHGENIVVIAQEDRYRQDFAGVDNAMSQSKGQNLNASIDVNFDPNVDVIPNDDFDGGFDGGF